MKPTTILSVVFTAAMGFLAFILTFSPTAYAVTTGTTIAVTGWNFPNGTNLSNGILPLFVPLAMAELFAFMLRALGRVGDFFVTMWLLGIGLGCTFLTMAGWMPIAVTIIAWVLLGLWWWTGGQGEGSGASGDIQLPRGGF